MVCAAGTEVKDSQNICGSISPSLCVCFKLVTLQASAIHWSSIDVRN